MRYTEGRNITIDGRPTKVIVTVENYDGGLNQWTGHGNLDGFESFVTETYNQGKAIDTEIGKLNVIGIQVKPPENMFFFRGTGVYRK